MKKQATPEQIREFRNMVENLSYKDNVDKVNLFMAEYNTMCTMFVEDGKTGVKDVLGEVLVPAVFDEIVGVFDDINRDFAVAVINDGKYGLVKQDGKGTMLAECIYDNIHLHCCCYYAVKDGKQGLYNFSGKLLVPVMADKVYEPWNGLLVYEVDGKFGFSMSGTDLVTEAVYEAYEIDGNEDLIVTLDGKKGFLDEQGNFTEDEDEAWFNSRLEW